MADALKQVDRFRIEHELGRGPQGVTWLAHDPRLDRPVALKLLDRGIDPARQQLAAKLVARVSHPSLVTLYDAGVHEGRNYWVFEFVEGVSLRDLAAEQGAIPAYRAVGLMLPVLDGLAHAHAEGIAHGRLSLANVQIDRDGRPRVLDLGTGGADATPATDVAAAAGMLRELLGGLPDPELDALLKDAAKRHADAGALRTALQGWLSRQEAGSAQHSTLEFLLRRLKHRPDFPAVSEHIRAINRMSAQAGDYSASALANAVLKDYSLTQKLLRVVNSSYYKQYGGRIGTVSRAVVILGFEQVRMAALGLVLFEHLQRGPRTDELREAALGGLMSGALARDFAGQIGFDEPEEAFLCSMFHRLGQHLALYYLPDEHQAVQDLVAHKGLDEETASRTVLGLSYEELGIGVAREWRFPDAMTESMRVYPPGPVERPASRAEKLRQLAALSNEVCRLVCRVPPEERGAQARALLARFDSGFKLSEKTLRATVENALSAVERTAEALNFPIGKTGFARHAAAWRKPAATAPGSATPVASPSPEATAAPAASAPSSADRQMVIFQGIQEVTQALIEGMPLNDVLTMVLETLYRGLGCSRVALCILDRNRTQLAARSGFGKDIDVFLDRFRFPVRAAATDPFNRALATGRDVEVADARHPDALRDLPDWFRGLGAPRALGVYPLVVNKQPFGFIYIDRDEAEPAADAERSSFFVNTLRNQAVLAIRQNAGGG